MKIAYINNGTHKSKAPPKTNPLELAYMKDIRIQWVKKKEEFEALGIDEEVFVKAMREKLGI